MSATHRSCIRLVNAEFYAWHGVNSEENRLGGKYEVDVELNFDFRHAAIADDIGGTVDYQQAYETVRIVMTSRKAALIESLAFEIASVLMQQFQALESVTAKVRKRNLPLGGLCDYAEAEHRIDRD